MQLRLKNTRDPRLQLQVYTVEVHQDEADWIAEKEAWERLGFAAFAGEPGAAARDKVNFIHNWKGLIEKTELADLPSLTVRLAAARYSQQPAREISLAELKLML